MTGKKDTFVAAIAFCCGVALAAVPCGAWAAGNDPAGSQSCQPPSSRRTGIRVSVRPDDPVKGDPAAQVTVVIFSEFHCDLCAKAAEAVSQVEATFGKKVRIVWKHMPLGFHGNSRSAAMAAEAAREQDRFWPMHDKLFANRTRLSVERYEQLALELGLDLPRFRAAMASPATSERVQEDLVEAGAAGARGTPSFLVDGELLAGGGGLRDAVQRAFDRTLTAAP